MTYWNFQISYQTRVLVCLGIYFPKFNTYFLKDLIFFLIFNCECVCVPAYKHMHVRAGTPRGQRPWGTWSWDCRKSWAFQWALETELTENWTCVSGKSSKCSQLWGCLSNHMTYTFKCLLLEPLDIRYLFLKHSWLFSCSFCFVVSFLPRMLSCLQLPDCTVRVWFL